MFGTSIPIAALPGIGASILTPGAANFSARSSAKFTILLTFTPGAGSNSYLVTAGPLQALIIFAFTLKLSNVSSKIFAFSAISFVTLELFTLFIFFKIIGMDGKW